MKIRNSKLIASAFLGYLFFLSSCSGDLKNIGRLQDLSGSGDGNTSSDLPGYSLKITSGDFQVASVNSNLKAKISTILLLGEKPVENAEITFSPDIFDGGLFLSENVIQTNVNGEAESPVYKTGPIPRQIVIGITAKKNGETIAQTTASIESRTETAVIPNHDFIGCVSGKALDTSRIEITYSRPANASFFQIKRNGMTIFESKDDTSTTFVDNGLSEGSTYVYTCHGSFDGIVVEGTRRLTISTILSSVPLFSGIDQLSIGNQRSLIATWSSPTAGPLAASFKIYLSLKSADLFESQPVAVVPAGTFSYEIKELGDELKYFIGVRACNFNDKCDLNEKYLTKDLPNAGPPRSNSISGYRVIDGKLVLDIPWDYRVGDVVKRNVYYKLNPTNLSAESFDLSTFSLLFSDIYPESGNVSQFVTLSNIEENVALLFYIVEEDRSGNSGSKTNVIAVSPLDLTPPVFLGITDLLRGSNQESEIDAQFIAVAPESSFAGGTDRYIVLSLKEPFSAGSSSTLLNPCLSGIQTHSFTATGYSDGSLVSYRMTGLQPRTRYSVCIKAVDRSNNTSITTNFSEIVTGDVRPPDFSGLTALSIDNTSGGVRASWQASLSNDIKEYLVYVWLNSATPVNPVVIKSLNRFSTSLIIDKSLVAFSDNDILYAQASACDDADAISGLVSNCTNYLSFPAKTISIPDTDPPPGFAGIASEGSQLSSVEGQVTVRWNLPTGTVMGDHYRGFKIYTSSDSGVLELQRNVNCLEESIQRGVATPILNRDCHTVSQINSATVTNLIPGRTYRFHVRAFDVLGNETNYLSPLISFAFVKVRDSTPPSPSTDFFLESGVFSWGTATDNQYQPENSLRYRLYRKKDSVFVTFTNPSASGLLVSETLALTTLDATSVLEGSTYYYILCVADSAGNESCLNKNLSRVVLDAVPPIIASPIKRDITKHAWEFTWQVSDLGGISRIDIYRKITSLPDSGWPKVEGTLVKSFLDDSGNNGSGRLSAPQNAVGTINYLVQASDRFGNVTEWRTSFSIEQTASILSFSKNEGPLNGGNSVIINLEDFDSAINIYVDNVACVSLTKLKNDSYGCLIPPPSPGRQEVSLEVRELLSDFDGFLKDSFIYTYVSGPGCQGTPNGNLFHDDLIATGNSLSDPITICTANQFLNIRNAATKKYFKLGADIDFSTTTNLQPISEKMINLNGDNYSIFGLNLNGSGLFSKITSDDTFTSSIINLRIYSSIKPSLYLTGPLAADFSGTLRNIAFLTEIAPSTTLVSSAAEPLFCGGLIGVIRSGTLVERVGGQFKNKVDTVASCNVGGIAGLSQRNTLFSSSSNRFFTSFKNIDLDLSIEVATGLTAGGVVGIVRPMQYSPAPTTVAQATGCTSCLSTPSALSEFLRGQIGFEGIKVKGSLGGSVRTGGIVGEVSGTPSRVLFRKISTAVNMRMCDSTSSGNGGLVGFLSRTSNITFTTAGRTYTDGGEPGTTEEATFDLRNIKTGGSIDAYSSCLGDRFKLFYGSFFGAYNQRGSTVAQNVFSTTQTPGEGFGIRHFFYSNSAAPSTFSVSNSVTITGFFDNQASATLFQTNILSYSKDLTTPNLLFWQNIPFNITDDISQAPNFSWFYEDGKYPETSNYSLVAPMP